MVYQLIFYLYDIYLVYFYFVFFVLYVYYIYSYVGVLYFYFGDWGWEGSNYDYGFYYVFGKLKVEKVGK